MEKKEAVTKFDALASELRLDIVKLLVQFGEDGLVAGEMSSQLDIPPTNLSFHLKTLTHAGLVYVEIAKTPLAKLYQDGKKAKD